MPKPWNQVALSFPHCFPGLFASLSAGKSWEQLSQSPQQWDSIRAHTKTLARGLHAKLSRLKISTHSPALVGFLLMKNNKFAEKYLRECSMPWRKHWTLKCHTWQMFKRENNKKYKARLLKEPPLELLQPLGRNKTLHWWKRHKKVKTCREQCERHLMGSSDKSNSEQIWDFNYQKQKVVFHF